MAMKLWVLSPTRIWGAWEHYYDTLQGLVVQARTEKEARALAAAEAGLEAEEGKGNPWLQEKYTLCRELTPGTKPSVILMDYID